VARYTAAAIALAVPRRARQVRVAGRPIPAQPALRTMAAAACALAVPRQSREVPALEHPMPV
jgi:hypothetical protein